MPGPEDLLRQTTEFMRLALLRTDFLGALGRRTEDQRTSARDILKLCEGDADFLPVITDRLLSMMYESRGSRESTGSLLWNLRAPVYRFDRKLGRMITGKEWQQEMTDWREGLKKGYVEKYEGTNPDNQPIIPKDIVRNCADFVIELSGRP